MKYLAIIQARCGSTRLPNKVLKKLCGKPALQWMIERVERSRYVEEVMVVTSIEKVNLPILTLCASIGVRVGIGSEEDVLDRFYQTAKLLQPEYVIRLTADCPCFDADLLDLALEQLDPKTDYCGMLSETFADGLDLEIIRFPALKKAWKEARRTTEREHVTQYIIHHPEVFVQQDFVSPIGDFGAHRWTVDETEDFELVSRIYGHFVIDMGTKYFGFREILKYLEENPEICALNKKYRRNEGLLKSQKNDRMAEMEKEVLDNGSNC